MHNGVLGNSAPSHKAQKPLKQKHARNKKRHARKFGVPSFCYTLAAAGQLRLDVDRRTTKQRHVRPNAKTKKGRKRKPRNKKGRGEEANPK